MWTGGRPPLGYDIVDKKLIVNETEAKQVRNIFEGYLQFQTVTNLVADLKKRGMCNKRWTSEKGIQHGGTPFQGGALYHMLQNRLYLGEIDYKGNIYQGEHKGIVPKELWENVQSQLEEHRRRKSAFGSKRKPYLLEGLIFDSKRYSMSPTYSVKKGNVRYPYYISSPLNKTQKIEVGELPRVPASTIDNLVRSRISILLNMDCLERIDDATVRAIVKKVTVYKDNVELEIDHQYPNADCNRLKDTGVVVTQNKNHTHVRIAAVLRRHSRELALINPNGKPLLRMNVPDPVLTKNLAMAYKWREQLESGKMKTMQTIADAEGCTEGFIRKLLPLAYLAPDIIEAILDGTQPASLDLKKIQAKPIPLAWTKQREQLGFSA